MLFFTDQLDSAGTEVPVTYGNDAAYFVYGHQYLSGANQLDVVQDGTEYISNTLFAHTTLPKCKHIRTKSYDFQELKTVRSGHELNIQCYFNNPLPGGTKFEKPVINEYSKKTQGVNTNFTWMPMKASYFKSAYDVDILSDASKGWSIRCFDYNNYGLPSHNGPNPAHLLWFPPIQKADGTYIKMRMTAMMTMKIKLRLYSRSPDSECSYQFADARMLNHYTIGSYNKFEAYPLSGQLY